MTKGEIEAVFARVRTWPEARQEDAARTLMRMEELGTSPFELTDEDRAAIEEALAEERRGDFATEDEVETFSRAIADPMRVRFLRDAIRDLKGIEAFLAGENPTGASRVIAEIETHIRALAGWPDTGHSAGVDDVRVSVVSGRAYLVFYRRVGVELRILRIRHGRRRPLKWL